MRFRRLAKRGQVQGWVAGAGFDGCSGLLEQGAACLPLLGTAAADVRRVRDPASFFGFLCAHGIGHPPVRHHASGDTAGWLAKDAGGCGGWHIVRAAEAAVDSAPPLRYWQREVGGIAMSATFIANGRDAVLLGHQPADRADDRRTAVRVLRRVRPGAGERGRRARGECGRACAGRRIRAARTRQPRLHARWRARVGARGQSRPPASMALYPDVGGVGVLRAHLRACLHDELPHDPQRPRGSRRRHRDRLRAARAAARRRGRRRARVVAGRARPAPCRHDVSPPAIRFAA